MTLMSVQWFNLWDNRVSPGKRHRKVETGTTLLPAAGMLCYHSPLCSLQESENYMHRLCYKSTEEISLFMLPVVLIFFIHDI